jgi:chromosome segregation ATPase
MISVPELMRRMSKSYAQIIDLLTTVDDNWSQVAGKLDPLEAELQIALRLAASLNANRNRVDQIATELAALRETALSDPLSTDAKTLTALATKLQAVRAELDELAAVRDTFEGRLARLSGQLVDLTETQRQTAEVAALVLAKIADPGLPNLDDRAADLRIRLDRLRESGRSGRWQQLAGAAEQLEAEVARATTDVRAASSALTGLLDRRAELRGRLDAYQAKARQVGYAEDLELTALHKTAHGVLFTAPCDLAAATVAVNQYRQAITERTANPATVTPTVSGGQRPADEKESR